MGPAHLESPFSDILVTDAQLQGISKIKVATRLVDLFINR